MKIVRVDKLKHHFEHVVDVKLFTVPNILMIIETFTEEVPDDLIDRKVIEALFETYCVGECAVCAQSKDHGTVCGLTDTPPNVLGGDP